MGTAFHWGRTPLWEQLSCSISESWRDPCGSGLASRKGCTAAPGFSVDANQAGVQPQPSAVSRNIITANPPINPG
ncbi:hypothetical protein DM819_00700 [Pseudomonas hunanensis]|uniref:Uncharacterized protein n=1 Tax=Pseudomonas hunanensis TaxID=1247546 RepID=A0ABD6MSD5_9PSED|nr:hypothetical protein [Pseudomonas hunanensis]